MALGLREGGGSSELEDARASSSSCYGVSASFAYDGGPPTPMQMDRHPVVLGPLEGHDDGRIPASVFERDVSEPGKDWSMMSTESVFGLQVAPSCDFTGYFLAHPELMDITTPPRDSSSVVVDDDATAAVSRTASIAVPPPFESIPEHGSRATTPHGNTTMQSYSFAFPNLIEDKSYSTKVHEQTPSPATAKAPSMREAAEAPPEEEETSNKPEPELAKEEAKGGWLSWMPCCS